MGLCLQQQEVQGCAAILGCSTASFPIIYLGIPLHYKSLSVNFWNFLVDKVERRLIGWKRNCLTITERLTLVNSYLRAIPGFWMSVHLLLFSITKKIDRVYRNFLWNGVRQNSKHRNFLSWSSTVAPSIWGARYNGFMGLQSGTAPKWWDYLLTGPQWPWK